MDGTKAPGAAEPVGHQGVRVEIAQRPALAVNGWLGVVVLAACAVAVWLAAPHHSGLLWFPVLIFVLVVTSLVIVPPGQSSVVQFFGRYIGTVRRAGFWWVVPLTVRRKVSVRVRNFETNHLKVNDADGNPVEIAAIVVWQVADTARSTYAVDDYEDFVSVQAESALRHVATIHPYDSGASETSLRGSTDLVAGELAHEVAERVLIAGVEVVEVRISHLAYAQEVAQAMLRRQQANAVVAARSRIVEGAVGMVEMALNRLAENEVVDLDEERKASMVSNLLVVLCGDQPPSPVVNTGSLYT
ncbi:SPFH domain-containing protein [Leekyejoonella antrihumi]|uniref:SPFH domain-containing protein n=1 Tax=Leekyejoonella antrihumi TaxID=1660198 RepID=A0A563DUP2_9MICO|nr:SPFH domain-containing protein [Leekyejoonella antrihumi]TWP33681.1 SPFH domain-containing protein [Leekyejoonella antrihumi]